VKPPRLDRERIFYLVQPERGRVLTRSARCHIASILVIAAMISHAHRAESAEGASSNYFPGSYGSLMAASAPEPGFVTSSQNLFYAADADRAVLQGRVNTDVDIDAYYSLLNGYYVHDLPSIGARLAVGGYLSVGYARLEAEIRPTLLPPFSDDSDRFEFGDLGLVPVSLYWNAGPVAFNVYEMIIAPTGQYDERDSVNIGRNYWSFDTVAAATWFVEKTSTDLSAALGIMANTRNPDTEYRTGTELHLDFMSNQFLLESLAIGFHGYYYEQVEGDSGSGAVLGNFKGDSVGIGAALLWLPAFAEGRVLATMKWLHDVEASNRIEADYAVAELVVTF
jgi:hypothetical protein